MNKLNLIGLAFAIAFLFFSCNFEKTGKSPVQKEKKIVQKWLGKKVELPDSLPVLSKASLVPFYRARVYKRDNIKIVTSVDGGCHVCMEQLEHWGKFIQKAKASDDFEILFYITGTTPKLFKNEFYHKLNFKYPLIIDSNFQLLKRNEFPYKKKYQTMLLNEDHKVIAIGNPAVSSEIKEIYLKKINNMLNQPK